MIISNFPNKSIERVKVYRISIGWKLFFLITTPFMIALFGWLIAIPFQNNSNYIIKNIMLFIIGGAGVLLYLYLILYVFKSRVEIHSSMIKDVGLFSDNELMRSEIKGFRVVASKYVSELIIFPKNPYGKKIRTAMIFENQSELVFWLKHNLTDLDALDLKREYNQISCDNSLGRTEKERLLLLEKAKKWVAIMTFISVTLTVLTFFWPYPPDYLIWVLMIFPLVILGMSVCFGDILKFDPDPKSAFPGIFRAFVLPCLGLSLRADLDFDILNWDNFWIPFIIFTSLFYILTLVCSKDARRTIILPVLLIIFCATYGYPVVIYLNDFMDRSTPVVYQAKIIKKRLSRGSKRNYYYFKLSPWGSREKKQELKVRKAAYTRHKKGDNVDIVVRNGMFSIPFYYLN